MIIYSMTATFGKLENETLTLQPGLNILHAPNEWGKSTWCAFLSAMLYGIETRVHTTKTALADKERYAPWSGAPMAGRIDLHWNGRDITIERSSKGRGVFNVFRAYETETGLEIPELTAADCGQMLLGVEKSVFLRSGFIRLTDLPVTQDEALRRRLNAMVTTGDESGTADALAQKLKDLKNRCRLNRSTGLLPQAEAQQRELQSKLTELQQLQEQSARAGRRLEELDTHSKALQNHKAALQYAASKTYLEKLAAAEVALDSAREQESRLQRLCEDNPSGEEAQRVLLQLRQLREQRDALHMEAQMLPPPPQAPEVPSAFQCLEPDTAVSQAETSARVYAEDSQKRPRPWYSILCLLLGIAGLVLPHWGFKIAGALLIAAGLLILRSHFADKRRRENTCRALRYQYQPIPPEQWVDAARSYAAARAAYEEALALHQSQRQSVDQRMQALQQQISHVTGDASLPACEQRYTELLGHRNTLTEAARERKRAEDLLQALQSSYKEVPAPEFPDTLVYTESETARLLSDCTYEQRQLQQQLDRCHGKAEALGHEAALRQQLNAVTARMEALETTYSALEIAQSTLTAATNELQRRFAPRISQRAQALFGKLTEGRYTRLTLGEDLAVHAGTSEEPTLYSALWRSDGTVDQLYLALRLAVAEELIPDSPLVLDDALVRFDDRRLAQALEVLKETAVSRQVLLFTCQSRESTMIEKE